MVITSKAFEHEGEIPPKYTCEGDNISPPLDISDIPANAQSLVLVMDDPDAPAGVFAHWVAYDLHPDTTAIAEGQPPESGQLGTNSFGKAGYDGPCPPDGIHRYYFRMYALDIPALGIPPGATKDAVEAALNGHVLDSAELMGTYAKDSAETAAI